MIRSARHGQASVTLCAALVFWTGACASSANPPAGPKHVPSASAEAATACPEERAQAQSAREALLGESGASLNHEAAARVFAHGQCEARALSAMPVPTGSHDQILSELRTIRAQMQNATNLYGEVPRYGADVLAVQASVAEAAVKIDFSKIVSAISPPADLDLQSRQAFESELSEAVRTLQLEASMRLKESVALARTTEGAGDAAREACELLATLGTETCP